MTATPPQGGNGGSGLPTVARSRLTYAAIVAVLIGSATFVNVTDVRNATNASDVAVVVVNTRNVIDTRRRPTTTEVTADSATSPPEATVTDATEVDEPDATRSPLVMFHKRVLHQSGFAPVDLAGAGADTFCGAKVLQRLGLQPYYQFLTQPGRMHVAIAMMSGMEANNRSVTDKKAIGSSKLMEMEFAFNARAVGPVMYTASITEIRTSDFEKVDNAPPHRVWFVDFQPFTHVGTFQFDVLLTWVDEHFLGQKWKLPNRNDNPSFEEKKRKCLALSLSGAGCDRFGFAFQPRDSKFEVTTETSGYKAPVHRDQCRREDMNGPGYWAPLADETVAKPVAAHLLNDPVGLNTFQGSTWVWHVRSCSLPLIGANSLQHLFQEKNIQRIFIFGDSMLVEQFNVFHDLIASQSAIQQGKSHGRRWMQFVVGSLTVRFVRCYTTSAGQSQLAPPKQIAAQLAAFNPDLAFGNLAVLHWQQNMMPLSAWKTNVDSFAKAVQGSVSGVKLGVHYFGHTLIQMGRTQGLQPPRTEAFTRAACTTLAQASISCFEPVELSKSRRESAYDGQHWACYHQYGGVAYTILSQFFNFVFARA